MSRKGKIGLCIKIKMTKPLLPTKNRQRKYLNNSV